MFDKLRERFGFKEAAQPQAVQNPISKPVVEPPKLDPRFKKVEFGGLTFEVVKDRDILDTLSEREVNTMFAGWRVAVEQSKVAHVLKYNPLEMYSYCPDDARDILTLGLGNIKSLNYEVIDHHTDSYSKEFINADSDSNIHVNIKRNTALYSDKTRFTVNVGDKLVFSCSVTDSEGPLFTEVDHMVPGEWFNSFVTFVVQEAPIIKGQYERQRIVSRSHALVDKYTAAIKDIPIGTYLVGDLRFEIPELPEGTLEEKAEIAEVTMKAWTESISRAHFVRYLSVSGLDSFVNNLPSEFVQNEFKSLNIKSLHGVIYDSIGKPTEFRFENPEATSDLSLEYDSHHYGIDDEYELTVRKGDMIVYNGRHDGSREVVRSVVPGGWIHEVNQIIGDKLDKCVSNINTHSEYGFVIDRRQLANDMFDL